LVFAAKVGQFTYVVALFGLDWSNFLLVLAFDQSEFESSELDNVTGLDFIALLGAFGIL
jgi:hypothetical protein